MSQVDKLLKEFYRVKKENFKKPTAKGVFGEKVVWSVLQEYMEGQEGFIVHSFAYPYQKDRNTGKDVPGNIKYDCKGKDETERSEARKRGEPRYFHVVNQGSEEIDCLVVTRRAIIPIEVKAYAQKIRFYDHWWETNSQHDTKSPISQTEKHCRHLYHLLAEALPDGRPDYIAPIVCFMDKSVIKDERTSMSKDYIKVTILNNLKATIAMCDVEKDYLLDIENILEQVKRHASSYEGLITYL